MNKSERMRKIVAQAWTSMLVVYVGSNVMDQIRISVAGSQAEWAEHRNIHSVELVLVMMSLYAVMPVLVRTLSARWFRGAVIGVTALMTLFVGAHEISHLSASDKPFGLLHALDMTHHLLGIWALVAAVIWFRQPD